jgi:formate dehydrogenase subunit gamma
MTLHIVHQNSKARVEPPADPISGIPAVDVEAAVSRALERHATRPGALLPVLHDVQHQLGFIPAESVDAIARGLNLSRAEVHGVITYYHHFRQHAPARHVVQMCQAEACQSMGAEALASHAQARLGCAMNSSTEDGRFALQAVYCLGLCASSPSMMIGEQVFARVTPQRFDQLIGALDQGPKP